MCGIAGIWLRGQSDELSPSIKRMTDAIAHRGPDADGFWIDANRGLAFGHRRLSILDLSSAGAQPMRSASGRYVITFNGEVYNFEAIRAELDKSFRTDWNGGSDTEVMLAAIEAWGLESALERFVGMFAFGLWDAERRQLHLVRDRFGVKPLYVAELDNGIAFASELKALRTLKSFVRTTDPDAISRYFERSVIPAPRTIYANAKKVMPGTIATFVGPRAEARTTTTYWSAEEVARSGVANLMKGGDREIVERVEIALREAVEARLVSDVPLGAFLSGGIDSSLVVALMQRAQTKRVRTFSIGYSDASYDEGADAARVAAHLGTDHTAFELSPEDALAVVPKLASMYDEPFADSSQIPTHLVSALARKHVTVALSGDGGDEVFGGYNRHIWGPRLWSAMRGVPEAWRNKASVALKGLRPNDLQRAFDVAMPLLPKSLRMRVPSDKIRKAAAVLGANSPEHIYRILTAYGRVAESPLTDCRVVDGDPLPMMPNVEDLFMLSDVLDALPDDILAKVDRASMAVSLEAREPLLDHRLYALAWRLPLRMKIRDGRGKWVLREVLDRYVPRPLVDRPKMGFGVPVGAWLRGPLRAWAEERLSEEALRADGVFDVPRVRGYWLEHLDGTRDRTHSLWDVLMFVEWRALERSM